MCVTLTSWPRAIAIAALLVSASFAPLGAQGVAIQRVTGLARVAPLTGENSVNRTDSRWNVAGTDLGHMFDMNSRLYFVFGDTFGHGLAAPPGTGAAPDWRCNVIAVSDDRDPSDGIAFASMITGTDGNAKELVHPRRDLGDVTNIPTNGVSVGNRMFLHYMAVNHWGDAGEWTLRGSGLAYSDNYGASFTKLAWMWPSNTRFGQVAFARDAGFVYLFGIPGGRNGAVCLARVPQTMVPAQAAYRYYAGTVNGEPLWSTSEADAVPIVPAPAGELSVMWNAYLKRWTMMYLRSGNIVIREAPELVGPWSAPTTVVWSFLYPGLYAPYMHPWLTANGGETVYFTMSEWGPYNVSIMRFNLVRRAEAPPARTDAARALQIAAGLTQATTGDAARLGGGGVIDISSVTSLLRQANGAR